MTENEKLNLLAEIKSSLKPIVSRRSLSRVLDDTVSPRTLANNDSMGKNGPLVKVKISRVVGYTRESVIEWLSCRL